MSKWSQPRQAVRDGKVVFFPKTPAARVYSILAYERKKGMKIAVRQAIYQECPGCVAWRTN